jgi:TRAP-type mannitol/chloroaromatic compound transport system permease small subunit
MTRLLSLVLWCLVLGSFITGATQAWMRYMLPVEDFSAWNHPWQGTIEALHVFFAPILVLVFGYTLAAHAQARLAMPGTKANRKRSGGAIAALGFVLVFSGAWMAAWTFPEGKQVAWIHGIAGVLFGLAFIGHALFRKRA